MSSPIPGAGAETLRRLRQPLGGKAMLAFALLLDRIKNRTHQRFNR